MTAPVRLCKDCVYSQQNVSHSLNCINPEVNRFDSYALSRIVFEGSSCIYERSRRWFGACGMKGKLWKEKT